LKNFKIKGNGICIVPPCAMMVFCTAWQATYFTLDDGTVCPGCPLCTQISFPTLPIMPLQES